MAVTLPPSPLLYLARRNGAFFIASIAYAAVALILLKLGWIFSDVIVTSGIFFILVVGLDLLYGYAGLLSLGHIGFFAIGAYVVAVLAKQFELPFFAGAAIALVFNLLLGVSLGRVFLRLRGSYFMLGTLAFGLVVHSIITVWYSVTGGDAGLGGVPRPALGNTVLQSDLSFGALVWGTALVLFWLAINLTRSRVGRALRAIRSDEISAAAAGIDVARLKTNVFALSAAYASISGSLFAAYNGAVQPDSFSLTALLDVLMMLFFGGEGTIWGGLFGATIMRVLPDLSGPLHAGKILFSGVLFTLIIFFFPQGIAGGLRQIYARLTAKRQQAMPDTLDAATPLPPAPASRSVEPVLVADNVGRSFGGLKAVDEVSFVIHRGGVKGLIGPNGAGKSTMLNLISGALSLNHGRILFDGQDLAGHRPDEIARLGVQRTFQHERLFTQMGVVENVMVGRERGSDGGMGDLIRCALALPSTLEAEQQVEREARNWLHMVGLGARTEEMVSALPHGLRKLVELARAAAGDPVLLLLDETAAGLNDAEKQHFKALIRSLRDSGVTILLIEHDTDFIMELSDEVVVMNFGRKIAEGTPAEVSRDEAVLTAYLGA